MWLVLDIGNSMVKGGLFDGEALRHVFHLDALPADDPSEGATAAWMRALRHAMDGADVDRVGISSVVPDTLLVAEEAARRLTGAPIHTVHTGMRLPFALAYETPQTLGTDRLAAAAAAWLRYGAGSGAPGSADEPDQGAQSVIAIDAGTAVTYEVIDRSGVYRGGAIAAGPVLMQRALRTGTAQLPTIPLTFPDDVIGRSTREAMQSGLMWSFVDSVQGMVARLSARLDDTPVVVVTGGWGDLLHQHLDAADYIEPHLVLYGVRDLLALNALPEAAD